MAQGKALKKVSESKSELAPANDPRAERPHTILIAQRDGETPGAAHSRMMATPTVNAGVSMFNFHPMRKGGNITDLIDEIQKQAKAVQGGSLEGPEAMLVSQAHALDTIFNALAQRASGYIESGHTHASETFLRLALKAQSQCRTTVEAIGELKAPRTATFIKQANIADKQQVNNGQATRAQEKDITPSNELLTRQDNETLDSRGAGKASSTHQKLATVEKLHRAK